jgi:hypothetical protein
MQAITSVFSVALEHLAAQIHEGWPLHCDVSEIEEAVNYACALYYRARFNSGTTAGVILIAKTMRDCFPPPPVRIAQIPLRTKMIQI